MDTVWKDRMHNKMSMAVTRATSGGGGKGVRSDKNDIHGWVRQVATLAVLFGGRYWTLLRCLTSATSLLATGWGG